MSAKEMMAPPPGEASGSPPDEKVKTADGKKGKSHEEPRLVPEAERILIQRIVQLRQALAPFADIPEDINKPPDHILYVFNRAEGTQSIKIADIRRARAAMKSTVI